MVKGGLAGIATGESGTTALDILVSGWRDGQRRNCRLEAAELWLFTWLRGRLPVPPNLYCLFCPITALRRRM
jgi:hypothetical protein